MPLKVIGAGLGRTATKSLKVALEMLGFGPCYHMVELVPKPEHLRLWSAAFDGKPDWNTIYDGYAAAVDTPTCFYYRELAACYPDAKVVLTVRDVEKWIPSWHKLMGVGTPPDALERYRRNMPPDAQTFFDKRFAKQFGDLRFEDTVDPDFLRAHFKQHIANVERAIPKERLLKYEVSQGWEPLCKFLGAAVPAEPFPRVKEGEGVPGEAEKPGEISWIDWLKMLNERRAGAGPASPYLRK